MVDALVDEAEAIVAEGIDARLAAADENAAAIAEATRAELLQIQGSTPTTATRRSTASARSPTDRATRYRGTFTESSLISAHSHRSSTIWVLSLLRWMPSLSRSARSSSTSARRSTSTSGGSTPAASPRGR